MWQDNPSFLNANFLAQAENTCIPSAGHTSCTPSSADTASYATYGYDGTTGNQTSSSLWVNTGGSLVSQTVYNSQGMPTSTQDYKQNATTTSYQCSGLFPYQITNSLGQVTQYGYDCNTGNVTSVQGPNDLANNYPGTVYSYSSIGDLQSVSYPDGGGVSLDYHGYALPLTVTTTTLATPDPSIVRATVYDGLGRVKQTQVVSDPVGPDYTDTTYDGLGRVASVSNPYRSTADPTYGITSYAYDALGRMTLQCDQDNGTGASCFPGSSYKRWTYTGNVTDVYDESGVHTEQTSDGAGRVIKVLEAGDSGTLDVETDYSYDPLNDLTSVVQLGTSGESPRTRTFAYDSLSRLTSAANPESGTTTYQYSVAEGPLRRGWDERVQPDRCPGNHHFLQL